MAHIRQSMPDSVLGFQVKVRKTFKVVPSLLGSGCVIAFSVGYIEVKRTVRRKDPRHIVCCMLYVRQLNHLVE